MVADDADPQAAGVRPRHARQVRFTPFGAAAQQRLATSHALIVGVGALGSHVADTLARAGVGRLTLVDRDVVEESNLQRQILFDEADARAGRPKAEAAAEALRAIDASLHIDALVAHFDLRTFERLPARPDLIVDGTDNFATRYLLNDLAISSGTPWIHGAVIGAEGRAMVVLPGETACLRCIMPEAPPPGALDTCDTAGVLAPAVAQVAAVQSLEALKLLGGLRDQLVRGLVVIDAWRASTALFLRDAKPRADCVACGARSFPALTEDPADVVALCGRDAVQVRPRTAGDVDLAGLAARLGDAVTGVELRRGMLRFALPDGSARITLFADGRALVFGSDDVDRARAVYDRYVGLGGR
ncbi:MAG: ThiF family adenylyltransferase [Planctomycetes bacterium]|nr:ThiF family adenylyltransferase [Planctomycetota bacterium]